STLDGEQIAARHFCRGIGIKHASGRGLPSRRAGFDDGTALATPRQRGTVCSTLVCEPARSRPAAAVRGACDGRHPMSERLPVAYLARHGETAWTITGQHTGLTDLPLTDRGERNASRLGERLQSLTFARVFTSPLRRALRTCELAGFAAVAKVDPDLVEWNYGQYEGRRTAEIRAERPARQ